MKVLEIAIGLILIYFLYSLLSSIIAEMISSWIGMRARMLRQGIENILNDIITGTRRDFVRWLKDIFLVEDNNFKYTSAGKFFEEPTIKYLAKPGEHKWYSLRNRKPAYISAENFVVTILNMFSTKGRGISEWDKIKFAIETNALHLDPETLKMFQDMVKRADNNFKNFVGLLQNHFADTMERVNGWYKRKIGTFIFFIGLFICIILNVDTIQIVKTLTNDEDKRLKMVELADKVILQKSTVDTLMSIKDSINDLKYKLEAHGIVKENVMKANDILALGWDFKIEKIDKNICTGKNSCCFQCLFSTKKDTVIIRKLISEGKNLRKESAWLQYIIDKKFPENPDFLKSDTIKKLYKQILPNINDITDTKILLDSLNKKLKKLDAKEIASVVESQTAILATEKIKQDSLALLSGVQLVQFDDIKRKSATQSTIRGQGYPSFGKKVAIVTKAMVPWESRFWGILITALALTLGSQFWFDLLKKLVALRSAGVKPEENEEKKKQLEKLKLSGDTITSKDPVEIAISQNRGYWESLPGFIAYNVIVEKDGSRYIEVTMNEDIIKNTPKDDSKSVFIDPSKSEDIQIKFKLAQLAEFQQGTLQQSEFKPLKGHLYIESTNSYGTPAGLVKNRRTNQIAVLTCGHVARPVKYSGYLNNNDIAVKLCEDQEGKKFTHVGTVSNIVMSSFADGGLIDIQDHKVLEKFNKIPNIDIVDHKYFGRKFYVKNLKQEKREAYLIDFRRFYAFNDGGKGNARFLNLLMFAPEEKVDYMSLPGDSGTLVYNENDVPVAIIMGGSEEVKKDRTIKYSYAIRLTDLKEILQFDLLT